MPDYPAIVLASWSAFVGHVSNLGLAPPTAPTFLFRGQADAEWVLRPRLSRLLRGVHDESTVKIIESRLMRHFEARSHHYLSSGHLQMLKGPDRMARWAVMQHYGAPTRILDWTESAYVAAYFACATAPERDGAIFITCPGNVDLANGLAPGDDTTLPDEEFNRLDVTRTLTLFMSSDVLTLREIAQMGHFSFSPSPLADHDAGILRTLEPGSPADGPTLRAAKWIVASQRKLEFLQHLRQMNIGAHSLFPGLDGLGRSLEEVALLHTPTK